MITAITKMKTMATWQRFGGNDDDKDDVDDMGDDDDKNDNDNSP